MTTQISQIPIIPSNPNLSWASMAITAMVVIDLSTEIGEYHRALESTWHSQKIRPARKAVNRAALQVIFLALILIILSGVFMSRWTSDQDWRMGLVLEGVSRLEAAWLFFFVSVKTPKWIGVYCSPEKQRRIQHVGKGLSVLLFHVRWTLLQYFSFTYCFLLPFSGRPMSALFGFGIGFVVEGAIKTARKKAARDQARIALLAAMAWAVVSSVLFADGCHYIQIVWGTGRWMNELGLMLTAFVVWLVAILLRHWKMWRKTEEMTASQKRLSVHDRQERLAMSLIFSHVFGSTKRVPAFNLNDIQEEEEEDEEQDEVEPTIWSLIKERLTSPSELVFLSQTDSYIIILLSIASVFIVVVNIGATAQINVVRERFHSVHEALYGNMDEGPVCAFDEVGGTITTFPNRQAARSKGYKVAHCGACGACSDWHNLKLQYTTRTYLAKESARCARKSLTLGRDAVLGCLGEPPIGFSGDCAECWTEDIFCARRHCAFIFLQSTMINTMGNFQVGEDTITSATCEEAMCELDFVPCSGANRRRMNITSSIRRPGVQLCNIVDVDWAEVWGEDGSSSLSVDGGAKDDL